ncbi:hypothetical protein F444_14268 [Phytophthora nicotianae P1976]|uniref:Uncharacterized protein n=1 Tax=Phytophthora nicotianae P1976 TaxID=1317066 RepID=A0A080ZQY7_PHYNI|nr:hypothetical protein F444_14268 [Phytophthora nicotianae P1976]
MMSSSKAPASEPSPTPPPLTCACKRERCDKCHLCSRCGCEHDGIPIAEKVKRGRGRPKRTEPKPKEKNTNGATVDRSDPSTRLDGRARRAATLSQTYEEEEDPEPDSIPKEWTLLPHREILRFFGDDEKAVNNFSNHCGSAVFRHNVDTWKTTEDPHYGKSVVFRMYEKILRLVAESVCGREAADASVVAFLQKISSKTVFSSSSKEVSEVFQPLASVMMATKRNSIERRTARAMLCGIFKFSEMSRMENEVPGFHVGKSSYSRGKEDFKTLVKDGVLETEIRSVERIDQNLVAEVITSIVSCDNVTYRLGETKRIVLDGRYYDVPALRRRTFLSVMWDLYVKQTGDARVSRSGFYRVCRVLTRGDDDKCTEVRGLLVDDSFSTMKRIISDFIPDESVELIRCLTVLGYWLEYGCFTDALVESNLVTVNCPRHQSAFGLAAQDASISRGVCCAPCEGMNTLFTYIDKTVKSNGGDTATMSVVHNCFEKIELYMAHRLRVVHQERAVLKLLDSAQMQAMQGEGLDEAVVTIDFKLNTEPVRFCNNKVEHAWESGLRWHGAMVHFWTAEPEVTEKLSEQKLYYNYIANAGDSQPKFAVAALIEAVLTDIKRDLPHIKRIVVRSDNATCYQHAFVAVLLPILGWSNGIEITRFIQTEVESGKSLLGAQFARAATHVNAWVRQDHDCTTPSQLVAALISDGGMPDTTSEAVEYDRGSLQLLSDKVGGMEKSFAALVGKVNDILYEYDHLTFSSRKDTSVFDVRSCPTVFARAFKYSEIGLGKLVEIDMTIGVCTLQACEDEDAIEPYDSEDPICESNWEQSANTEDDGDGDNEDDSELNLSSEVVLPRCAVGLVTGVRVVCDAQIRRRTRKLPCSPDAVSDLPASREPVRTNEKNMVTWAKQYLIGLKNDHSHGAVDVSNLSKEMTTLRYRFPDVNTVTQSRLQQGWAQRPAKERMDSVRCIPRYMNDVNTLLKRGGSDRHDKMGPKRIVEVLRSWNTTSYDIPGENEVRAMISQLRVENRKRGAPTEDPKPRKKRKMEQKYADFLQELVTTNPQIGRKEAVPLFRKKFPEATTLYSDVRLKSKISILKGMLSKAATNAQS